MRYLFGPFELDTERLLLLRSGEPVHLEPRVFELLTHLVSHPNRVVPKDELTREVWSGAFITDGALKRAVGEARRILGDSGDRQRYIQTSYGRGYLFAAEVQALDSPPVPSTSPRFGVRWGWVLGGLSALLALALVLDVAGWRARLFGRSEGVRGVSSMAVLPLQNFSSDPAQEYLADGVTEALTSRLGAVGDLKVISRTSMMRYKGAEKSALEIARELGVDALLEGSVVREGDEIGITVQLIDGRTDSHLWTSSYRRATTDILSLESDVARSVAAAIRLRLRPREEEALRAGVRAVDPEAYEAYLKGESELDQATPEGLRKASEHFRRALELDPELAPAHVGMGRFHFNSGILGAVAPTRAMPLARESAGRALEIDESSVEAHVLMGFVQAGYDLDFEALREHVQQALRLNPNQPEAHWLYGAYFLALGELERALGEMRIAWKLDPFEGRYGIGEAWSLTLLGREDEALAPLRHSLDLNPEFPLAHAMLSDVLIRLGRVDEGMRELQTYYRLIGLAEAAEAAAAGYLLGGVEAAFGQAAASLEEIGEQRFVSPSEIASAYARAGRPDEALHWLERAIDARDAFLWQLRRDLTLESLHGDPRFDTLTRRLGLPE